MSPSADRNLLFGIVALQMDFISRDQLIEAMNAWAVEKNKPLGEILVARGAMTLGDLALLTPLVARHIEQHGGDPAKSLASLSSIGSTRGALEQVADAEIRASLAILATVGQNLDDPYATRPPAAIGDSTSSGLRFHILRPHDKGGLGKVSVALDSELNREVALKEIHEQHADKPESRARFLLEAEVTGGLEHPGIVPVYGLGTYPDGRPFYAMRFIRGDNLQRAIQRFHGNPSRKRERRESEENPVADASGSASVARFDTLEFRQLLGRFVDVCNAVAYAHSRQVLHRDLKPGNIMLGKYGETLVVDWGLAKVAQSPQREQGDEPPLRPTTTSGSSETAMGSAVGTPAYMPPEQAEGRWDLLSAASDVYSLGATLYELLTGKTPFQGNQEEVLAAVKRGQFPPPRQVNPAVPPALEAVCLKAMALKPTDRYGSALYVAKEIERWLADEPVTALKEPITAQARRWVRKHSRLTTGIAATLLVGAIGLGALAWQREQARQSVDKERAETAKQRDQAEQNLAYAKKGNELLGSVFAGLDPARIAASGRPLQDVLKDNLSKAVRELEGTVIGDPLAVAEMQMTLGNSLNGLGLYEQAAAVFEKVRGTRQTELGPDHLDTLKSMNNLGISYAALGRYAEALGIYKETLKLMTAKLGPDHPNTLANMNNLANSYDALGRHVEALALRKETLKLTKATLGSDHPDTLRSMNNLAISYAALARYAEALGVFEETLKLQKAKLGPDHPHTLMSMNNLANSYAALGRHDDALALRKETLKLTKATLGSDHPDTLRSMINLANSYVALGRHAEALALEEETLKLHKAKLGPEHPATLLNMSNLAKSYVTAERPDDAIALIEYALPRTINKPGIHPAVVPDLIDSRLRAMAKKRDAAGCRTTAEMWEKLNRTDADSLYAAACFRAVCAAVMREKKEDGADEQAAKAIDWLKKAVAAGYKNIEDMKKNKDLDAVREREDFKKLIAEMEAKVAEKKSSDPKP